MLDVREEFLGQLDLQHEMWLQYEALSEEMLSAGPEKQKEYLILISNHLRRLSKYSRESASSLRSSSPVMITSAAFQ